MACGHGWQWLLCCSLIRACVRIAVAGWLHGVCVGECFLVFPLCGFSLSLFCNYHEGLLLSVHACTVPCCGCTQQLYPQGQGNPSPPAHSCPSGTKQELFIFLRCRWLSVFAPGRCRACHRAFPYNFSVKLEHRVRTKSPAHPKDHHKYAEQMKPARSTISSRTPDTATHCANTEPENPALHLP